MRHPRAYLLALALVSACVDEPGDDSGGMCHGELGTFSTDGLIEWYLASGEWRERAGGYAIQGRGAALVEAIEGDYTNVVGLPVPTLLALAPWLLAAD